MLKPFFTRVVAFAIMQFATVTSYAISPDLIREVSFSGEPFAVTTDQASGEIIVWTIEAGEVVTYDEDGVELADCTAPLGLGNFSLDPFDELDPVPNIGSRITRVSGSIASIVDYDFPTAGGNQPNTFFAVDCNQPGEKLSFPSDFQIRFVDTNQNAFGLLVPTNIGDIFEPASLINGNIQILTSSDVPAGWVPLTGLSSESIQAGTAFNFSSNTFSPYLFGFGFLGNGEGLVEKIASSPLDPNTIIFSVDASTRYFLESSQTFVDFPGYDAVDSNDLGFLISNSSECLLVENASDVASSSPIGSTCLDSEDSGSLFYVIADGLLRVFDTAPTVMPPPGDCIDSDGDGYGWDGFATCFPNGIDPNPPVVIDNSIVGDQSLACIDTDGDGWGWNGIESCRPPQTAGGALMCIDTDGDGWGWTGSQSCQFDSAGNIVLF